MKKILIAILLTLSIAGVYIFMNKLYYPPLPIESMSKKEVVHALKSSDEKIVPLTVENGKQWVLINERSQPIIDALIIDMLQNYGWAFKAKEGSGLFFEKQNTKLIVTTEKWTSNYSLVDIPINYK